MFSYWTKKTTNKTTERKSNETIEGEEQNQGMESIMPQAQASDERLQEFQEFLKRVQTLQMSPTIIENLESADNYFMPTPIEVGVEPSMLMELDEKDAIAMKGSPTIAKRSNFNSNSANIRVNVGIDKDLEMILEMDPSIVDLGDISAGETTESRVVGLPPLAGG